MNLLYNLEGLQLKGVGEYQEKRSQASKYLVLKALARSPVGLPFVGLRHATSLSTRTLSKRLAKLVEEEIVEKVKFNFENLEGKNMEDFALRFFRRLQALKLTKENWFRKSVLGLSRERRRRHPADEGLPTRRWRMISEIYFEKDIEEKWKNILKEKNHNRRLALIRGFIGWLEGFYTKTKTPDQVKKLFKQMIRRKTVYRLKKPKAKLIAPTR